MELLGFSVSVGFIVDGGLECGGGLVYEYPYRDPSVHMMPATYIGLFGSLGYSPGPISSV